MNGYAGSIMNAPGDNILADFPSAVEAVLGAVEIQKVLEGRNLELPAERRMEFRNGVNLGDVIEEDDGTSICRGFWTQQCQARGHTGAVAFGQA
ncbi:MAG: hypothetical protein QF926_09865 [Alphaproteobacteria bacterium]|jgi:class 3 adenylate cyclase|nr:hypothetical protein [Alphaproteobacteria bacterium]